LARVLQRAYAAPISSPKVVREDSRFAELQNSFALIELNGARSASPESGYGLRRDASDNRALE